MSSLSRALRRSRSVFGEKKSSGKQKILPGIGRLGKLSGGYEVMKLTFREVSDLLNVSQKSGTIFKIFRRAFIYTW